MQAVWLAYSARPRPYRFCSPLTPSAVPHGPAPGGQAFENRTLRGREGGFQPTQASSEGERTEQKEEGPHRSPVQVKGWGLEHFSFRIQYSLTVGLVPHSVPLALPFPDLSQGSCKADTMIPIFKLSRLSWECGSVARATRKVLGLTPRHKNWASNLNTQEVEAGG